MAGAWLCAVKDSPIRRGVVADYLRIGTDLAYEGSAATAIIKDWLSSGAVVQARIFVIVLEAGPVWSLYRRNLIKAPDPSLGIHIAAGWFLND